MVERSVTTTTKIKAKGVFKGIFENKLVFHDEKEGTTDTLPLSEFNALIGKTLDLSITEKVVEEI